MKLDHDAALRRMKRLLANGPLVHLPGSGADLELLLALAATRFTAGRKYGEREVNDALAEWLQSFCAPGGIDHVTLRRSLVDARFLSRDRAGSTYETGPRAPGEVLGEPASPVDPAGVLSDVRRERESRKRGHAA